MQIINNPDRADWATLLQRPYYDNSAVLESVQSVLNEVKQNGDESLQKLSKQFDGVEINEFAVSTEEIESAGNFLSEELKSAIQQAKKNIETFHNAQAQKPEVIASLPGVECWRKGVGIERVGLYIPGGTAPLF